ncbi:hypothetical protein MHBO_000476 [Bonamia ostreae]|uniref:Uncharacterized protein n=1 Tax=Bonamia ostreae TaxID=126728 RepID=A0ABV2AFR8_9EUKA
MFLLLMSIIAISRLNSFDKILVSTEPPHFDFFEIQSTYSRIGFPRMPSLNSDLLFKIYDAHFLRKSEASESLLRLVKQKMTEVKRQESLAGMIL